MEDVGDSSNKLEISVKDGSFDEAGDPIWVSVWVNREIAKMSNTISDLIGDCDTLDMIPLDGLDKESLEKFIVYCELTKSNTDNNWKVEFFNISTSELVGLTMGANFLDMSELFEDSTAAIAASFKGKSPEQIRKEWQIPEDLTEEEEKQIRRENEWALDL